MASVLTSDAEMTRSVKEYVPVSEIPRQSRHIPEGWGSGVVWLSLAVASMVPRKSGLSIVKWYELFMKVSSCMFETGICGSVSCSHVVLLA
jgi:hypothetical protein